MLLDNVYVANGCKLAIRNDEGSFIYLDANTKKRVFVFPYE